MKLLKNAIAFLPLVLLLAMCQAQNRFASHIQRIVSTALQEQEARSRKADQLTGLMFNKTNYLKAVTDEINSIPPAKLSKLPNGWTTRYLELMDQKGYDEYRPLIKAQLVDMLNEQEIATLVSFYQSNSWAVEKMPLFMDKTAKLGMVIQKKYLDQAVEELSKQQ